MLRLARIVLIGLVGILAASLPAGAQTTTYHLHKDASTTTGLFILSPLAVDATSLAIQSIDLKNQPIGEYEIKAFDTQAGVPGAVGTIPSGSTLTFTLWMKKTANWGTMYPRARVRLNNASGSLLCESTGTAALTTSLTSPYTLTCTTGAALAVTAADRLYLWVGINLTQGPGNKTVRAELDVEGTPNGTYDSRVIIPNALAPSITSLSPQMGVVGTAVTIAGANFGATQGTSTVTFNGVPATPTLWSNTSLTAPVPAGTTNGPVVVTVNGAGSNGLTFTLLTTGTMSGTVTRVAGGAAVAGALVEALQVGLAKGSALSDAAGAYSIPHLVAGTYDVRVTASGLSTETFAAVGVTAGATTTRNAALYAPGSVTGTVTQSINGAVVVGASITVMQGGATAGSAMSNAAGQYTVSNLHPGSYTLRASAHTHQDKEQLGAVVNDGAATTVNFSLDPGGVQYAYDELGRLASVTRSSGESARYTYDAVGNVLSIARTDAPAVSVSEFTPNRGAVGTTVTIFGTGFSATPSANTVTFSNGVPSPVTYSTPTQIVTTVPSGATSGPLNVTTPTGSTSTGTFVVETLAPLAVTSFNPTLVAAGTPLTIDGTGFDPVAGNNRVTLNLTFTPPSTATTTQITGPVPFLAAAGKITVTTPRGAATSAADLFVAPLPYVAADVVVTGRMNFGETRPVPIGTAGKVGVILFDAVAGQRASLSLTAITMSVWRVSILGPNQRLVSTIVNGQGTFLDAQPMPVTGTYSIVVAAGATSTGNITVQLNDCPDVTGTITPGGSSVPVAVTTSGQNAWLRFDAVAGQRVGAKATNSTMGSGYLWILKPDGTALASGAANFGFLDAITLPVTGRYALVADPTGANTGSITLTLYHVLDVLGTIAPANAVGAALTVPGQNAWLNFTGTAGQRVSANITGVTMNLGYLWIIKPDGASLTYQSFGLGGAFLEPVTLPDAGTYAFVIDPGSDNVGNAIVTFYNVPNDLTGTTTVNAPAQAVTIGTPGQNATITFPGTSGQLATVRITGNTFGLVKVSLLKPDGSTLTWSQSGAASFDLAQATLNPSGTYTISIDPNTHYTGTLNVRVTSP